MPCDFDHREHEQTHIEYDNFDNETLAINAVFLTKNYNNNFSLVLFYHLRGGSKVVRLLITLKLLTNLLYTVLKIRN